MRLFELDYSVMVDRLRSVYALAQRADIEGERAGAELAFKRLLASIARDFGEEKAAEAERQVKASYGKQERPRARTYRRDDHYQSPPKREKPRQERPRQKSKRSTGTTYTHNGWTFSILRFTDPSAGKRGSDKVWGFAVKDTRHMTFWGAFGKAVRVKEVNHLEAIKKYQQKTAKGYKPVFADPIDYGYIFSQSDTW
ncbi:hypothetical protein LCGC14_1165650 [marine sediment metagenome]|uniref:Uncharacterized protein n=1 Tax=marine sediment metagenome TaxID=412755 RepID=A0A0F9MEB7_9ZZZZ